MSSRIIVQLPYLHASGSFAACAFTGAHILDPGHAAAIDIGGSGAGPRLFRPGGFPFAEQAASALLREMREMDTSACSAWLAVADRPQALSEAALDREMTDILRQLDKGESEADFRAQAEAEDPLERLQAEQAQKLLLLAWLQEERRLELEDLGRRVEECSGRIAACLDNAQCGEDAACPAGPDDSLLAHWRLVVENALFFLPENIAVGAIGPLREALLERLEFAGWPEGCQSGTLCCRAPLWQAFGQSAPPRGQSAHARASRANRLWLLRIHD